MTIRLVVVACLCSSAIAAGQTSVAAKPYEVADAYKIYSLLLPHEESYGFARDTLMIGEETESSFEIIQECLTPEAALKFRDAIAGYNRVHREKRHLLRRFQIEKSYKLVGSDVVKALPDHRPGSIAYVMMSPVGFNRGKTRAIVYMRSSCGSLCGSARFHLLEKVNGIWKEVPGDICPVAS